LGFRLKAIFYSGFGSFGCLKKKPFGLYEFWVLWIRVDSGAKYIHIKKSRVTVKVGKQIERLRYLRLNQKKLRTEGS
jgi:hypothetical protein